MVSKNITIPSGNAYFGNTANTHANSAGIFTGVNNATFTSQTNGTTISVSNTSGGFSNVGLNTSIVAPYVYTKYTANVQGYCYPRTRTVYTSSQAWTPPQGNIGKHIMIMCWGGGGSGAFRAGSSGGGGGGAFSLSVVDMSWVLDEPTTWFIVVGAGGAAKSSAGPGINGGASYFGNGTSNVVWGFASGGCGGGNTGAMANGGSGGSMYWNSATAGLAKNDESNLYLSTFWVDYGQANVVAIAGGGAGTGTGFSTEYMNEAISGILGYGGGGGSANTTDFWVGADSYCCSGPGGGGGSATNPTNATIRGGFSMHGPGMINVQPPGFNGPGSVQSPLHTGAYGGAGANSTTNITAASLGGGGGGGVTGHNSGKGGDGLVIVTIF